MPSLSAMKGEGFYDRHSSVQHATFDAVAPWIDEAVATMALPDEEETIGVADYGCSEGANSIAAVGRVVEGLRKRRGAQAICGVHLDLPGNNFNKLFANLYAPDATNYVQEQGNRRPNVSAMAAAGSFYEGLLPPRSVHFAMSFLALEWLDKAPDVPVPEFIGCMRGSPEAYEAFAQQAERDLTRFLERRAVELAPGGQLLIIIPGRIGERRTSDGLYDVLNDACVDLVSAGRLTRDRLERFVLPVFFRSLDELLAPLDRDGSPVQGAYRVARAESREVPTPFVEQFHRTGDAAAYAVAYCNFLRACSEPVIAAGLVGPDGDPTLTTALYERVRERLLAEPERYLFHNLEVAVLLTRV